MPAPYPYMSRSIHVHAICTYLLVLFTIFWFFIRPLRSYPWYMQTTVLICAVTAGSALYLIARVCSAWHDHTKTLVQNLETTWSHCCCDVVTCGCWHPTIPVEHRRRPHQRPRRGSLSFSYQETITGLSSTSINIELITKQRKLQIICQICEKAKREIARRRQGFGRPMSPQDELLHKSLVKIHIRVQHLLTNITRLTIKDVELVKMSRDLEEIVIALRSSEHRPIMSSTIEPNASETSVRRNDETPPLNPVASSILDEALPSYQEIDPYPLPEFLQQYLLSDNNVNPMCESNQTEDNQELPQYVCTCAEVGDRSGAGGACHQCVVHGSCFINVSVPGAPWRQTADGSFVASGRLSDYICNGAQNGPAMHTSGNYEVQTDTRLHTSSTSLAPPPDDTNAPPAYDSYV